jgi:hypothetical protein
MPTERNTYDVNPEQSNPLGVDPPQTYGTPKYCLAVAITLVAVAEFVTLDATTVGVVDCVGTET